MSEFVDWAAGTLNDSAASLGNGLLDCRVGDLINLFMDQDIYETGQRMNHAMEERSYLEFYFSDTSVGTNSYYRGVRRIPFFENPEITESRSPIYAKTQIVQRNEPARLYVGTDVRKVSLKFSVTFPHILDFYNISNFGPGWAQDRIQEYVWYIIDQGGALLNGGSTTNKGHLVDVDRGSGPDMKVTWKPNVSVGPRMEMDSLQAGGFVPAETEEKTYEATLGDKMMNPIAPSLASAWGLSPKNIGVLVAAYMHYMIDTVRASVLGNSPKGLRGTHAEGPPIVRLRHGTNFYEEPFIVTNYNIDYDNAAGMDPRTLLPRRMHFRLQLEEFRQTKSISDSLPGFSDVFDLKSLDRASKQRNPS